MLLGSPVFTRVVIERDKEPALHAEYAAGFERIVESPERRLVGSRLRPGFGGQAWSFSKKPQKPKSWP